MGGNRLEINLYHSIEEIEEKMKKAKDSVEYKHWMIIKLLAMDYSSEESAKIASVTYDWIRKLIHRYNKEREDGLKDKRKDLPGRKTLLNEKEQKELFYLLQDKAPDGGLWTGPKVTKWIEEKLGIKVAKGLGLLYIKKLGFVLRKPRPKNIKAATRDEKRAFKKN